MAIFDAMSSSLTCLVDRYNMTDFSPVASCSEDRGHVQADYIAGKSAMSANGEVASDRV